MSASLEHGRTAGIGRVALEARLARPFWGGVGLLAVACGALASGWAEWNGPSVSRLFLVWLLADLAWGAVWDLLVGSGGTPGAKGAHLGPILALPYTQPGSASDRLFRALHSLGRDWAWRTVAVPLAIGVTAGLAALLPEPLRLLSVAALALCLAAALVRRHEGHPSAGGQALLTLGLPWLAGHVAFAPPAVPSLVVAAGFTLGLWGHLSLLNPSGRHGGRPRPASRGVLRVILGQVAVGALVAWLRQPWLAAGVLALLLPALALWPALAQPAPLPQQDTDRRWYMRWAGVGLLAALPLAALALAG